MLVEALVSFQWLWNRSESTCSIIVGNSSVSSLKSSSEWIMPRSEIGDASVDVAAEEGR
jgi:hypothetical protein